MFSDISSFFFYIQNIFQDFIFLQFYDGILFFFLKCIHLMSMNLAQDVYSYIKSLAELYLNEVPNYVCV